jgi:hypothetical protein
MANIISYFTNAAHNDSAMLPNKSEPMPAMSPTLSPTLSAMHAGLFGSSSSYPNSNLILFNKKI